jgi:hypothetical protein
LIGIKLSTSSLEHAKLDFEIDLRTGLNMPATPMANLKTSKN